MNIPHDYNIVSYLLNLVYTKLNYTYEDLSKKMEVCMPVVGKLLHAKPVHKKTLNKCIYFLEENIEVISEKEIQKARSVFE